MSHNLNMDLRILSQWPPECRSEWAEADLASNFGTRPVSVAKPRLSLAALRDPSLSSAERMKLQEQLEKQAERKKRKLLDNIETAMHSHERQPQGAAPSLVLSAFDAARRNIEIGDTGAAAAIGKGFTKGVVTARDKMVRVWSHVWQTVDLQEVAQPATLAHIVSPVLLYGSPHAASSLLKSLPKLYRQLDAMRGHHRDLVRPSEIEYLVRSFAEDDLADNLEQRLARHAWGEIAQCRQPANDSPAYELPRDADRLLRIMIEAAPKKTKLRRTRRGIFTPA